MRKNKAKRILVFKKIDLLILNLIKKIRKNINKIYL